MADPATMAVLSIGSSVAGGLLGASGAQQSAKAESEMYQYKAGIALANKRMEEQNANYAYKVGEQETARYGIKARQNIGSIRAAQSGSGLDINSGSAAQVRESAHDLAGMDMATIRQNAARQAYGYTVKAWEAEQEAGLLSRAASNAKQAGKINMFASLIGSASSVSSKWSQAKQTGIF
jgi:hypothetical protein